MLRARSGGERGVRSNDVSETLSQTKGHRALLGKRPMCDVEGGGWEDPGVAHTMV